MAITIDALFKNVLETGLNRIFTEEYNMSKDVLPIVYNGNIITADTNTITWTAAGSDTSTITDNTVFLNPDTRWNLYPSFEITDNDIVLLKPDIKEELPKTYLQLPIGKRLISI